jgi:outer membrane protein OmpA-like peptidoglycan-associated protein
MPKKGIKRIQHTNGKYYPNMGNGKCFVVAANEKNSFEVAEWVEGTTDKDKEGVKWLLEDGKRNEILLQFSNRGPKVNTLSIPPAMCGVNNTYYLEASLTGQIDRTSDSGLYVRGYCEPLVVSSKWCDSRNNPLSKDKPIAYGDDVILHVDTQGLCNSELVIKIYHRNLGSDLLIDTYPGVKCTNGQVNLLIQNTFSWYAKIWHIQESEYYVTIEAKEVTGLVKDTTPNKDTAHARYLRIDNKLLNTPKTAPTKNLTPVRVGDNDLNIRQFDPCGFSRIEVKDESDRVVLFDEGKLQLKGQSRNNFAVSEEIHYDYDKSEIRADARPVLDKLANFLLESPYVPVELGSHTDSRGTDQYNMELSNRRASAAVAYLISKGILSSRISAKGYGKTAPLVPGNNLSEADHQKNRRTTLKFRIFENDAQSLIYETIAPDSTMKKKLDITVKDFNVDGCVFAGKEKHTKDIKVVEQTGLADSKTPTYTLSLAGEQIHPQVYANLSKIKISPLYYIWPISSPTDNFLFYINTCRYFSNKLKPSVLVRAYTDIKWTFEFDLNLTQDLSIKGTDLPASKLKELQKKAGKIGAERRWKEKEASCKFSLRSDWNKSGEDFKEKKVYETKDFDFKIKRFYDLFASIGNIADGITSKTKGRVKNIGIKGVPITFEVKPPNMSVQAMWYLKRAHHKKQATENIGTQIEFKISAKPLIGLEMTIDLLALGVETVAGAVTEGTGATAALDVYDNIQRQLKKGIKGGNDDFGGGVTADVWINLIISSVINLDAIDLSFNTVGDGSDSEVKVNTSATLKAEISAGVKIKAEVSVILIKADGYFEMSASASGSVTFGHSLHATDDGLYYRPQLGFDGLDIVYTLSIQYAISTKKSALAPEKHELFEAKGKSNGLVPKFDVIKSLEHISGLSADIYLFRNENN